MNRMDFNENTLDDPKFQREIVYAVKVLDMIAKISDDNRAELPFKRADGTEMRVIIQEEKHND